MMNDDLDDLDDLDDDGKSKAKGSSKGGGNQSSSLLNAYSACANLQCFTP
jgi:hypothetical protein